MLPGDPKIGCSYTRFEDTCEKERPWFIMKVTFLYDVVF